MAISYGSEQLSYILLSYCIDHFRVHRGIWDEEMAYPQRGGLGQIDQPYSPTCKQVHNSTIEQGNIN